MAAGAPAAGPARPRAGGEPGSAAGGIGTVRRRAAVRAGGLAP